jgi:hypothetical protein
MAELLRAKIDYYKFKLLIDILQLSIISVIWFISFNLLGKTVVAQLLKHFLTFVFIFIITAYGLAIGNVTIKLNILYRKYLLSMEDRELKDRVYN